MHIGLMTMGNLQTTRPYVHGKALWGALTARITRDTPAFNNQYKNVGCQVNEELAFSYFYPTIGEDVHIWPWEDPERFAWHFLGSYASTALDYGQNSAEEGMLHETEYIAPYTRSGKGVKLVGYVMEKDGCQLPWRTALKRLQIGGERTYGWGKVGYDEADARSAHKLFNYDLQLDGERPIIRLPIQGGPLLAHGRAYGDGAFVARGRVVPLLGRETQADNAHGRIIPAAHVCWEPGSQITGDVSLAIGHNGLWQAENQVR